MPRGSSSAITKNINVGVRVRPMTSLERERDETHAWEIDDKGNSISRRKGRSKRGGAKFQFDQVYGPAVETQEIYDKLCRHLVSSGMEGINGTMFAYGQTSSGKTYTMKGTENELGIIPLAVNHLFHYIATAEKAKSREYLLTVSYLEIYNESMMDLLRPKSRTLSIKEDRTQGVFVDGLHEQVVCSVAEVLQSLYEGEQNRHFAETLMNKNSSRSHTIFRVKIESRVKLADDRAPTRRRKVQMSCLNFVDLAGSERLKQTGAEGKRMNEGMAINKSLMFLGVVIRKLADKAVHVPFRDSTLTRILQTSLGGNSQTAVIANVSPAESNIEHTINTLRFAQRAVKIQNTAKVNLVSADKSKMNSNEAKIAKLRHRMSELPSAQDDDSKEEKTKTEVEAEKLKKMYALRLQHLQNLILCSTTSSSATATGSETRSSRRRGRHKSMCFPRMGRSRSRSRTDDDMQRMQLTKFEKMVFRVESLQSRNKTLEAEAALREDENRYLEKKFAAAEEAREEAESKLELILKGTGLELQPTAELQRLYASLAITTPKVLMHLTWKLFAQQEVFGSSTTRTLPSLSTLPSLASLLAKQDATSSDVKVAGMRATSTANPSPEAEVAASDNSREIEELRSKLEERSAALAAAEKRAEMADEAKVAAEAEASRATEAACAARQGLESARAAQKQAEAVVAEKKREIQALTFEKAEMQQKMNRKLLEIMENTPSDGSESSRVAFKEVKQNKKKRGMATPSSVQKGFRGARTPSSARKAVRTPGRFGNVARKRFGRFNFRGGGRSEQYQAVLDQSAR